MIQYYYTKWRLFWISSCLLRSERKSLRLKAQLEKLKTILATGFTSEKEFSEFNKRLIENRKRSNDPLREKELQQLRNKHFNNWQPKKRFKDSRDKQAQQEAHQRTNGFVRVIKNRPIKKDPDDLVEKKYEHSEPMFEPDTERK